jgi:hypothetical protein
MSYARYAVVSNSRLALVSETPRSLAIWSARNQPSLVGHDPRVEFSEGWDLGKRFSVAICAVLFALTACGDAATSKAGIAPVAQAAATLVPTPLGSAPASAAPATALPAPKTASPTVAAAITAPATQAPATQAPATRAPATVAPTAKPIAVVFTSVRSPVSPNGTGLASVSTAPNISCDIVVTYKSGASKAQGLTAKTSDAAGVVTWTWTIGTNTTAGTWPIDVTCGGARGHATFVVL